MKTIAAVSACEEAGLAVSEVFKWQYMATDNTEHELPLESLQAGDWTIYTGSGLPVTHLQDSAGQPVGVLLGVGVDHAGLVSGTRRLETTAAADSFFADIEDWLHTLAGRYTVFMFRGRETRVYCDPVGMNGCVYNPETRMVASSVLLCLDRPRKPHPYYPEDHLRNGGRYSLFHTSDPDVSRCNPNCYLDLSDFSEHRFWPGNKQFSCTPADLPDVYDQLQRHAKFIVEQICIAHPTAYPISGGQDSRLLLSLSGSGIRKIDTFFTHIHNYASRIDATIASDIARRLQLEHKVIDRRETQVAPDVIQNLLQSFEIASGASAQPGRELIYGLLPDVPKDHMVLRGHQTDLLRAVFTDRLGPRPRKNLRWQIKRLQIVTNQQFNNRVYDRFEPFYRAWLDTVPPRAAAHQIDLMFLEIYYSATIGCSFPAISHCFFMSPFNSRELIALCLGIPEHYRRSSAAVFDCIHRFNPGLSDVPFDFEFGGGRGLHKIFDLSEMSEITAVRRDETLRRYQMMLHSEDFSWDDLLNRQQAGTA